MSNKDPFAEADDAEKTVIKPNPGGRRNVTPSSAALAANPPAPIHEMAVPAPTVKSTNPRSEPSIDQGLTGMNQINAMATTLFSLIGRIRNRAQHMEVDKLRDSVESEVRSFESKSLQVGIDAQDVKIARYAICATLDDVVLNTPWGSQSSWAQRSMVGTFQKETVGGDRFYDLLARLEKSPHQNIELLEFMYMCLSLGFEGRLRVEQNGSNRHIEIRGGLASVIRNQRGEVERDLSPHWKGLSKPHEVLSIWKPVWITSSAVALLLTVVFLSLSYVLNQTSEKVLGQLSLLNSGEKVELLRRAPPPPPPPEPKVEQITQVKAFLEEEINEGLVEIYQDNQTITVRIAGSGMFGSGSDSLKKALELPLSRVAAALNGQIGPIIIVGHSDNVPIRSSRFPSNMHLSIARAESVMRTIAGQLEDPDRLRAEGRADKDPIGGAESNNTSEGRAKNRRIEIVLVRENAK
jgi:type VI secretion system protein ImpK